MDQLSEDPQEQVEDGRKDGHASCTGTSSQPPRRFTTVKSANARRANELVTASSPSGEQMDGSSQRMHRAEDTSLQSLSVQSETPAAEDTIHNVIKNISGIQHYFVVLLLPYIEII